MSSNPLEFIADQLGNVVKYDKQGNPSVFVPFVKMKSKELDDSLPDHVHPAFIVNGAEQDKILLGKYMAVELTSNGTLYSLPNMPPRVTLGMDPFQERMRAFGNGVSGMTIADHGLLVLLAHKNKWEPHGNNAWGADYRDAAAWDIGQKYNVNDVRGFRGWRYKCLVAHTSALEILPVDRPDYWQRLDFVGGTPVASQIGSNVNDEKYRGYNTLTGSGPLNWFLGSDPASLADVQGNAYEQVYGVRLVKCEIQILKDNDAADPNANTTASGAWKAILPHAEDDGFDLVAPGTSGTVHYTWENGKITLDTVEPEFDNEYRGTTFKDMAVNAEHLPHVPYILYELGLAPIKGTTVQGYYYIHMTADERVPRRGGSYDDASGAGVAFLHFDAPRPYAFFGGRPRSLLNP